MCRHYEYIHQRLVRQGWKKKTVTKEMKRKKRKQTQNTLTAKCYASNAQGQKKSQQS
jgi:hypothetical protein